MSARVLDSMTDRDGVEITFSVHRNAVRIHVGSFTDQGAVADFDAPKRDEFMRLWCEAERQAEAAGGGAP